MVLAEGLRGQGLGIPWPPLGCHSVGYVRDFRCAVMYVAFLAGCLRLLHTHDGLRDGHWRPCVAHKLIWMLMSEEVTSAEYDWEDHLSV